MAFTYEAKVFLLQEVFPNLVLDGTPLPLSLL